MMKNYGKLVPVVMVLLLTLAWYTAISETTKKQNEYEGFLEIARENAALKIESTAVEYYQKALTAWGTPDIYIEIIELYRATGNTIKLETWIENFMEAYPLEPKPYEYQLELYKSQRKYEAFFDVVSVMKKRNVTSEYSDSLINECKFNYEIEYDTYDDVRAFSSNLAAVCRNGKWGFINRYGTQRVTCMYPEVGVFTSSGYAPVSSGSETFFINTSGEKKLASHDEYAMFGSYVEGIIPARRTDGKYVYLNDKFEVIAGPFDYASAFNGGIAIVKNGIEWVLVNSNGEPISGKTYQDIVLDDKGIAFRNDRLFVKQNGKYIMIDKEENQISTMNFEEAFVFPSSDYTAVKDGGKWFFIDKDANRLSEKTYSDARPFLSGFAAVQVEGLWGYIDMNEKIIIKPQFLDARDFTEKGSAFVSQSEGKWQLLKIYSLNREE